MKINGKIKKRFTVLIYDNTGTFVRLKLFSGSTIRAIGICSLGVVLLIGLFFYDYIRLKQVRPQTLRLQSEIAELKADIKGRDQQIEFFNAKIDALQLKMIKLTQLEKKIRAIAGDRAVMDHLGDYGIGGGFSDVPADGVDSSAIDDALVQNLNRAVNRLDKATLDQSQEFKALWATLREIKRIQDSTPSIRPVEGGWISSGFGYRKSPFTGKREFHTGVDIATHMGSPVEATADGVVVYAGPRGLLGNAVIIDHGFGISTKYGHLSSIKVAVGQAVKRGQVIGNVGSTGRSTGPHLHYEVLLNNIPVNAAKYLGNYLASKKPSQ